MASQISALPGLFVLKILNTPENRYPKKTLLEANTYYEITWKPLSRLNFNEAATGVQSAFPNLLMAPPTSAGCISGLPKAKYSGHPE